MKTAEQISKARRRACTASAKVRRAKGLVISGFTRKSDAPTWRTPIPKRRSKPRRGPLRDKRYMAWLHDKPCACGCNRTPCDPAHTVNNGMRSKGPDSSCVPLFRICHESYDKDRKGFERRTGRDMKVSAARWYARYQEETLYATKTA